MRASQQIAMPTRPPSSRSVTVRRRASRASAQRLMVRPIPSRPKRVITRACAAWRPVIWVAAAAVLALIAAAGSAYAGGTLRGRITGFQDKLIPEVYAEAAKDQHRYTWRELSPTVRPEFRPLSAVPMRDICIAATINGAPPAMPPVLLRITGGRTAQTTVVVTPGTKIVFENRDPFPHRLVQKDWKAEINAGAQRDWQAPGPGRFEFRDELFPSVRTFVIVDPQVSSTVYPGRDGAFSMGLTPGEYALKAFFQGKQVGKTVSILVRDRLPTDIKEPLNLAEGAEAK